MVLKYCYYCGQIATSKEHIPAKALLNGHADLQLITVPSCNKHNQDKTMDDMLIGRILVKPTLSGYKIFKKEMQNPEFTKKKLIEEIDNSLNPVDIRKKKFYKRHLLNSESFIYKDGTIEVTELGLDSILEYFKSMLIGTYYYFKKNNEQLLSVYPFCSFMFYSQFDNFPPTFMAKEAYEDYKLLETLKSKAFLLVQKKQHRKYEFNVMKFSSNFCVEITSGRTIIVDSGDLLIFSILHGNICVVGIFSSKDKPFTSLHHL